MSAGLLAGLLTGALGVLAVPGVRAEGWTLRLRAQAGEEYDSNAQRVQRVTGGTDDAAGGGEGAPGDFLTRLLVQAAAAYSDPALVFQADYACGAKLFARETSEHLVANQLELSLLHHPQPGRQIGLRAGLRDATQATHGRDYLLGNLDAVTRLSLLESLALEVSAGGRGFYFKLDDAEERAPSAPRFSHAGPGAGLSLQARLGEGWSAWLGYAFDVRFFSDPARVAGPDGTSLVSGDRDRQDQRHALGAHVRYRSAWWGERQLIAQLGYGFTANGSNSRGSTARWHKLEAVVSLELPLELTLHLMGSVQLTAFPDGLYVDQSSYEPDADENENAFVSRLAWRFWESLQLVAQVAVYRNTFAVGSDEQPTFARETYLLGLAWDWSAW
jgi:hypothetical protein